MPLASHEGEDAFLGLLGNDSFGQHVLVELRLQISWVRVLLHEEVDVQLRVIHDETMWVFDPLQSFIHGLAVDVDPASSSGGQEVHVDLFHFLCDLGTFSMSHVLTGLPETQVLRLEKHKVSAKTRPSQRDASSSTLGGILLMFHLILMVENISHIPSLLFIFNSFQLLD